MTRSRREIEDGNLKRHQRTWREAGESCPRRIRNRLGGRDTAVERMASDAPNKVFWKGWAAKALGNDKPESLMAPGLCKVGVAGDWRFEDCALIRQTPASIQIVCSQEKPPPNNPAVAQISPELSMPHIAQQAAKLKKGLWMGAGTKGGLTHAPSSA